MSEKNNEVLDFSSIISIIQTHKQNAYRKINEELVIMYYEIGEYLSKKVKSGQWGDNVIYRLSIKLKETYPNIKGFGKTNLYQAMQFYETYSENVIFRTLAGKISWTNNLLILQGTKSIEEKEFYLRLCIKNNY